LIFSKIETIQKNIIITRKIIANPPITRKNLPSLALPFVIPIVISFCVVGSCPKLLSPIIPLP
jgi:hypothetical protein